MTTCRPLPKAGIDEKFWETEGEQSGRRGKEGGGEEGPSKAEGVGPGPIIDHFESAALKTSRKYTLGQCFFSYLS